MEEGGWNKEGWKYKKRRLTTKKVGIWAMIVMMVFRNDPFF